MFWHPDENIVEDLSADIMAGKLKTTNNDMVIQPDTIVCPG